VELSPPSANLPFFLPLRIFNYTEYNFDPTINAVSTIFVVLALVLTIALDRLIGLVRIG